MRNLARCIPPIIALITAASGAFAQLPTSQPGILTVIIEDVKIGRQAEHTANEAGWPAAFAKSHSPDYYLALEAMTGTNEVWYGVPFENFAKEGESMKRDEADAALSAELARLSRTDAEYLNSVRTIQAIARPDLSFRVYQVSAGMPGGTCLIFSTVADYSQFDTMFANDAKLFGGMTAKERSVFDTFAAEGLMTALTNRYRLDPTMSYVAPETKAVDPAFWSRN